MMDVTRMLQAESDDCRRQRAAAPPPLLLTYRQVGELLSLSERTIWGLVASGELPAIRVGRAVRVSRQAVEGWIARQAAQAS